MENAAKNKVRIKLVKGSDGMLSYDVQVLDQKASVQDYLDGLNLFQEEMVAPCDGCSNCCWERVPLTAPDVLRYAAAFYGAEPETLKAEVEAVSKTTETEKDSKYGNPLETEEGDFNNSYLYFGNLRQKDTRQNLRFVREYAEIRGGDFVPTMQRRAEADIGAAIVEKKSALDRAASPGIIDIYLRREAAGNCVFLDLDKQRCRAHAMRPLVCQSYVCLPSSRRAEALRRQIVNEGENELIRILGEQVAGDWRDYQSKGFEGKEHFADVALRDVVNEGLWQHLLAEE